MRSEEKGIGAHRMASRILSPRLGKEKCPKWKWFIAFVILIISVLGIWIMFFSYAECKTWDCFNGYLKNCDRVKFVGGTDMIFEYTVKGISGEKCEVDVKLLQGELDKRELVKIKMQKMTCELPKGVVMIPESNIGNCHGLLKEKLQGLIIERLHNFLVQNLGQINLKM